MKRILLLIIAILSLATPSSAVPPIVGGTPTGIGIMSPARPLVPPGDPVVYSGTLTGLRISSVDGTAFIDNAGATVPTYADGLHSIEIYDASGRMLKGVLKEAGSAEGLSGSELVANNTWDDNTTGWTVGGMGTLASSHPGGGGQSDDYLIITSGAGTFASRASTATEGMLVKESIYIKSGTNGALVYRSYLSAQAGNYPTGTSTASWVQKSGYQTNITLNGLAYVLAASGTNGNTSFFDELSMQQVTAPTTSGATIQASKADATENFGYKNASFTYNATSYTVIVRLLR